MKLPFLRIDKRSGMTGEVIGAAVLAVCAVWFSWKLGVLFAAMFLLAGFVRLLPKTAVSGFPLNALTTAS